LQRPVPDNTQHSQETNIHVPGGGGGGTGPPNHARDRLHTHAVARAPTGRGSGHAPTPHPPTPHPTPHTNPHPPGGGGASGPTIPARERLQTHALARAATGVGLFSLYIGFMYVIKSSLSRGMFITWDKQRYVCSYSGEYPKVRYALVYLILSERSI
jgi:hypothetical protein